MKISGKKRKRQFRNHDLCQEVAKLMNEYAANFGTSKDASAMSRAILPKLTAKWETISNMGPLNKVSCLLAAESGSHSRSELHFSDSIYRNSSYSSVDLIWQVFQDGFFNHESQLPPGPLRQSGLFCSIAQSRPQAFRGTAEKMGRSFSIARRCP